MEETKKYTFRDLNSTDMFPIFTILKKIGIEEVKKCFQSDTVRQFASNKNKTDATALGINIMLEIGSVIIANIPMCENDIYNLLADTSDLSIDEIKKLSMAEFAEMIIDFVKRPDFADFFKVVSKLFK